MTWFYFGSKNSLAVTNCGPNTFQLNDFNLTAIVFHLRHSDLKQWKRPAWLFCALFTSVALNISEPTTVTTPSWAKPLENFPCVCCSRSHRSTQRPFKVIFFIGKLQMKCMPQKQFHLSPNEAFKDPVSKLWCNKLLPANINEICSLIAKQVDSGMIRCATNACLNLLCSRSGVQTNCGCWEITNSCLKI